MMIFILPALFQAYLEASKLQYQNNNVSIIIDVHNNNKRGQLKIFPFSLFHSFFSSLFFTEHNRSFLGFTCPKFSASVAQLFQLDQQHNEFFDLILENVHLTHNFQVMKESVIKTRRQLEINNNLNEESYIFRFLEQQKYLKYELS